MPRAIDEPCHLGHGHRVEHDVADGVQPSPAAAAAHLTVVQRIQEDAIGRHDNGAARHVDAVSQGAGSDDHLRRR